MSSIVESHGGAVLEGGKYGSNNGFDIPAVFKDADGNVTATIVIDAKQLNSKGVVLTKDGAGIDHVNMTIPAFEIKTTDTGNRQSVGALDERMEKWINAAADTGNIGGQPV